MSLKVTILGSGSSMGVPRLGGPDGSGDWGNCDPAEPKNRRTRCSILVQQFADDAQEGPSTNVLVDTSPDLRAQLLNAKTGRIDAVLITHDHADQTHGIDDLRVLAYKNEKRIPVFLGRATSPELVTRFGYCFQDNPDTGYPAILTETTMPDPGAVFSIDGPGGPVSVSCFWQEHGAVPSLGFTFFDGEKTVGYSSDVNGLPEDSFAQLEGCDTWILDALRYQHHGSHSHLSQSVEWIERVGARRGVLTNLHIDMDYKTVLGETPPHIEPAYDGMVLIPGEATAQG